MANELNILNRIFSVLTNIFTNPLAVTITSTTSSIEVEQGDHDHLQCNANLQINDTDVSASNKVPTSSTLGFVLDGVDTQVVEDTVVPANNTPLPVKITSTTGDINITAGDLNVQLDHTGASYDSVRIGDGANLVKVAVEDAAHTTGDTGFQLLAVRNDAGTSLVDTDGDYAPLMVNANGMLNVNLDNIRDTAPDIGAGAAGGGTLRISIATDDNVSTKLTDIETNTDYGAVVGGGLEATALRVTLASDSTGIIGATQSGTWNINNIAGTVSLPTGASTEATLATVETNTDSLTVVGGGAEATALRVTIANDSTGVLSIDDNGSSITVDGAVDINVSSSIGHISNAAISNAAATQIDATSHTCKKCIITASENNTGWIRVGGSSVTSTTGIILYASESYELEINNSNLLYAFAEVNNEDIAVTYIN